MQLTLDEEHGDAEGPEVHQRVVGVLAGLPARPQPRGQPRPAVRGAQLQGPHPARAPAPALAEAQGADTQLVRP